MSSTINYMSNISTTEKIMSKEDKPPFGGFFAFIGAFVGLGYAVQINDVPLFALGGLIVGGWLGYIFEHILFRLIVIGLFVLMIVARQAFFGAVFDASATHFPIKHLEKSVVYSIQITPPSYAATYPPSAQSTFFLAQEPQKWV